MLIRLQIERNISLIHVTNRDVHARLVNDLSIRNIGAYSFLKLLLELNIFGLHL